MTPGAAGRQRTAGTVVELAGGDIGDRAIWLIATLRDDAGIHLLHQPWFPPTRSVTRP